MDKPEFITNAMNLNSRRYYIERITEVSTEEEEIIGYLRLSTQEQAHTTALDNQKARLIEQGITLLVVDIESGKVSKRPGLKYTMQRVSKKQVKSVIVTRLDRLGRTTPIIRRNVDIFRDTGVNLIAIDQEIDLHSPHGMFLVNILASLAEMEVEQTSDRIRAVKEFRRQKQYACDYAPFGYITENNQYKLNTQPYLCLLEQRPANYLELYSEDVQPFAGLSIKDIARDCIDILLQTKGCSPAVKAITTKYGLGFTVAKKYGGNVVLYWSNPGLNRWSTNPILQSHTVYGKRKQLSDGRRVELPREQWQVIENTHPDERLITDTEAAKIQRILAFNRTHHGYHLYNHDPSQNSAYSQFAYQRGLVYCDQCGQRCSATSRHSKDGQTIYYYYYCKNRLRGCPNGKGTRRDLIESTLIEHLLRQSVEPIDEQPAVEPIPASNPYQEKLARLEVKLKQLEEIDGFDSDIEELKAKTRKEIERVSNPFNPETLPHQTVQELIEVGNGLLLWHALSADEKVEVYPRLIERITINNGGVVDVSLKRPDATALEIEALESGRVV